MSAARALRLLFRPLDAFFRTEALGGTVLILATVAALIWANSPLAEGYRALWATEVTVGARGLGLSKPLALWVNDLLMAVFFLVVGLEIKRELLVGELNSVRKAMLSILAAVGGMLVPAAIFLAVARGTPASRGWGVPMATDIAFALGCLRLLGKRVPPALIVYLTALAIIDDLGAILVIALFYASGLSLPALGVAAVCIVALVALNVLGVRRPGVYVIVGIPLWVAILKSGIHATIAGVIVGLCVPARALFTRKDGVQARELLDHAEKERGEESEAALRTLEHRLDESESPLARLEHALHPWVAFAIVPIFALANAGVSFAGVGPSDLTQPAAMGVLLGLVVGKQAGVFGATYAAVRFGAAVLPGGVTWRHVHGASLLAGIGFTMSLFIAGLTYGEGTQPHVEAKLGILSASLICALAGMAVLGRRRPAAGLAMR
jgi:NhaA family Na+:H+ antiporter